MRSTRIYPALLAIFLVVVQWRQAGPLAGRGADLVTSIGAALVVVVVGTALARFATKDPDRRALVTLIAVLFASLFSSFVVYTAPALSLRIGDAVILWTAICALLVMGARHAPVTSRTSRVLTIALSALLTLQLVGIASSVRPASSRVTAGPGAGRSAERPDVYVIVLDKYSATRWLRDSYGFDNRPFEDSLRQLGFYLPARARTNYPHTSLVLATLLDGRLVHRTVADPEAKWPAVFARIENAQLLTFLRDKGYRFAFFPTSFNATWENKNADLVITAPRRVRRRSPFHTFRANAPFDALLGLRCGMRGCATEGTTTATQFPYPVEPASAIAWKLRTLGTLPDSAGPIVAFLHVLAPHEPYQFRATCEPYAPWWPLRDDDADTNARHAYRDQVECVNTMVLATVRALLARSAVPPIIIIQADHGHARMALDAMRGRNIPLADLSPSRIRERLDVFGAYLAPGGDTIWYDSISPANVIPRLLNARFGAAMPANADSSWWVDDFFRPLALTPVTAAQLRLSRGGPPSP